MSITIDDIPVVSQPTKISDDTVLYASNLAGGNPNENYASAKQEIAQTGDSSLVQAEKDKWLQEQGDINQQTVESLISDSTVPIEQRRAVMESYVKGAIPLQNLRDKFLAEAAVRDVSTTVADREAQTAHSENVHARDTEKQVTAGSQAADAVGNFLTGFVVPTAVSSVKVTGGLAAQVFLSIPAGLAAGFELMRTQDPERASEVLQQIQSYAYTPSDELSQKALENIKSWMDTADIPFKWAGDQAMKIPLIGGPTLATAVYTAGTMVGYIGAAQGTRAVLKTVKGKANITPTSPLDTIETASKEQASNISAKAMADPTGQIAKSIGSSKEEILNTYVLPKIEEEFGSINPDGRVAIEKLDTALKDVAAETEFSPHVYPTTQIIAEREAYVKILTETQKPHLLLSSSVLDISPEMKLFGRAGKGYEALVDSTATKLQGTAVFGRNANFGYKTELGATNYLKKLEDSVSHLPDSGKFEVLNKDGQYYISWKFTREYQPHESLAFGEDTLSAHLFAKKVDITDFANSTIGKAIFPAYMRMKGEIPAQGAAAAREEARVESVFLREARDTFMKTEHPTELSTSLRKGEEDGKSWTVQDIQTQHPHLKKPQAEKLHTEYVAYRRIVDHLYALSDRKFVKDLESKGMKSLYNKDGEFVTHASEPIPRPDNVTHVWDLEKKERVQVSPTEQVVKLNSSVRQGDHILEYAKVPQTWQSGPIRAGALTKVPGYIPRYYKEWFVVEKTPKAIWVNGQKVAAEQLRNHKETIAMAGSLPERETLLERLRQENPENDYGWRKEEKDINDKIIHDSKVYDTYLKQIHRRGERLPALDRPAEIEDVLVSLTRAIRSTSKVVSWDDLQTVRRDNFLKAYGKFTDNKFPQQITDIKPLNHMNPKEERELLSAQSVYEQLEREQISSVESDIVWRNGMGAIADIFEKAHVDGKVLREWGEKGFIPARIVKAVGANLWLYWRPLRMWVVQPQQFKELALVSPAYAKHLAEIIPVTSGLLARTRTMSGIMSHADAMGRRAMPDYDRVIAALEESGVTQSVDMNQMVHGIWKDATKELAPKPISGVVDATSRGLEAVSKVAAMPGKLGRGIGYNPSETMNQVSLWLFARHRWIEQNPGKNWDTLENRAQIARDQSLYSHMSSTRAGMYGWQDGLVSVLAQFVAIPWKSTLQMISSPQFTAAEKARLAGARVFWYGKYGLPMAAVAYKAIENNIEDKNDRETLAKWTESATDRMWNYTMNVLYDAQGEKANVDTKNLSTVIDGEYVWNVIDTLIEMSKGNPAEMPKMAFPFQNAVGSVMETVRTIYDIFQVNNNGIGDLDTWKAASWKAVSFAGAFSDFNKAMMAEGMGKAGNGTGYAQTRGEAVARLFGIPPTEESLMNMAQLSQIKRTQEIKGTAKQIHQRLIAVMQAKSVDEQVVQKEYLDGLSAFLNTVPEQYKTELTTEIFKQDKYSWKDKKDSLLLNIYKNAADKNDVHYNEMRNALEKSNDPEIKSMLKDLDSIKQWSMK